MGKKNKKNKQKKSFKKIIFTLLILVFMTASIAGGLVGYAYIKEKTDKAEVIMTLNYENSSAGLNPDNSKFNLRFFKSEEVLRVALDRAGVSQHITTNELASFISMKGVSSKAIDVNSDTKYIDSTYKIKLVLPEKYHGLVSAKKLLDEVCKAYKEWFVSSYVVDSKALVLNTDNLEDVEYSTISSYFDMMVIRGKNYLDEKEQVSTAFIGSDGTTWKSLRQELSNLTEYDIQTFNQYIWENGIAKNKGWAVTILEHKTEDLKSDYDLYLANVEKYALVVDEYRNEMTSSVLIPTYDENEQFYMSRTKTGIDDISKSMDTTLEEATIVKEKIDINIDKIVKLENSTITTTDKADIMLMNIQNKIISIFERIKVLDEEYVSQKTADYVRYEFIEEKSLLDLFF